MSPKSRGRKKKPTRRSAPSRRDRDHLRVVPDIQGDDVDIRLRGLSIREQKMLATQRKREETAAHDAEARREFAMPHREAVVDGERYTDLDPSDEDDLHLLILGEHPEYQRVLVEDSGELIDGVDPRLRVAMLQILVTRLWNDEPKSTWREAKKHLAAGHSRTDILNVLLEPVTKEVWSALSPELGLMGQTPRRRRARSAADSSEPRGPSEIAFQVRVDIHGMKPPIWRRLVLPATMTLSELHLALQIAFDWTDSHLHAFRSGIRTIGNRHQLDNVEDEAAVRLADLLGQEGDRLDYEYDFGDSWVHRLVVEQVVARGERVVACIGGRQPAPAEDSGGVWGYSAALAVSRDPHHPQYAEVMQILQDTDAFHVEMTDDRLRRIPVS